MTEIVHVLGIILALAAAFAGATQYLFLRIGTDRGAAFDAVLVVMLTNIVLIVPPVLIVYYPSYGLTWISILSFAAAGLFGTLLGRMCMYSGVDRIGSSRTAPVVALWALISTLLGVIILGESLSVVHGIGVVLIVGGIVAISWETRRENPDDLPRRELLLGLLLPIGAATAFGIEPIFANFGFAEGTPAAVGLALKTIAATTGFVLYLRVRNALPTRRVFREASVRWFVFAGLGNTGFLYGYYLALEITPVSIVAPIIVTNTLWVVVLSAIFMPQKFERVSATIAAATVVVVSGVLLITIFG